jgi:hypothetical protein
MRPGWWQNCEAILRCRCAAQGIEAEILFYCEAVKKIAAESPVSGAKRRKSAQILILK